MQPNLMAAFSKIASLPMEAKKAYALARVARTLESESRLLDSARTSLIRSYNYVDSNGNAAVPQDKMVDFVHQMNGLGQEEFDVFLDKPVQIAEDRLEGIQFTVSDFVLLEPLIDIISDGPTS